MWVYIYIYIYIFFAFINFFFFSVQILTLLVKKVLIGFGQRGDHKTSRTSWASTCIKILKEINTRGLVILTFGQ